METTSNSARPAPRIGDQVRVTGTVKGLVATGGIPGALVDVGGRVAPVWLPLAVLTPAVTR